MSSISQGDTSLESASPSIQCPIDLLTVPAEVRHELYKWLFAKRVTTMTSIRILQSRATSSTPPEIVYSPDNDMMSRTERSSQILRTCRMIFHEAVVVLYGNTTFYLHGGAHLSSLKRYVDCRNIQNIILRTQLEDTSWCGRFDSAVGPLFIGELVFPSLRSFQIKIRIKNPNRKIDSNELPIETKIVRGETLSRTLQVQKSHGQLNLLLESYCQGGDLVAFRLAGAGAARYEDVRV